jgi:hypothetical protein
LTPEERPGQAAEGAGAGERAASACRFGSDARQADPAGGRQGKLISPARRRSIIDHVRRTLHVSERRACSALGQHRSTQRKRPKGRDDEAALTADIVALARQYGRYGYRKIAELLRIWAGWVVNDKRVERIWRQEGLKVPAKQPKRGRLWLADGSCVRLRATHRDHVWSYDFVEDRTHDGRKYRMLNIVDEYTHECLAIRVSRRLKSIDVIDVLSDLFILRGVPGFIRSDNVLTWQSMGKTRQQISLRRCVPVAGCRNKNQVASTVQGCALNHSELRIRTNVAVLTVLKTRYATKWKARTLSTGSQGELRPHGSVRAKSFHLAPADRRTAGSRLRSGRSHARRAPSWRRRP